MTYLASLQNQGTPTVEVVIVVVGLGIALGLLILVFLSLRKASRELAQTRSLIAVGEPARAKILRMWDTGTTLNDNPKVKFLLEVFPGGRGPYRAEVKCYVSRLKLSQVQPGNEIAVKIDPEDETKIALDLM